MYEQFQRFMKNICDDVTLIVNDFGVKNFQEFTLMIKFLFG